MPSPKTLLFHAAALLLAGFVPAQATLSFETDTDDRTRVLVADDTITFPTLVGAAESSVVNFRIRNIGDTPETVERITLEGAAFPSAPIPALPLEIAPGSAVSFDILFRPPAPGDFGGLLTVGDVRFSLQGSRPAVVLVSTLKFNDQSVSLDGKTRVSLPSVTAGGRLEFTIVVENLGQLAGDVRFLDLSGFGFAIVAPPPLPASVPPGGSIEFSAVVAPRTAGALIGVLRIDDRTVQLETVAANPPQLTEVRITNLPDPAPPLAQPVIGLELPEPYPADLTGTLSIEFTSESFVNEPGIVFSTGFRQVDVRIPAGSTEAVFGPGLESVALQTGSTAGLISLSTTLRAAGINVTGETPLIHSVRVEPGPPAVHSVDVETLGDRSFRLLVTGYATSREISQMDFQFKGRPGVELGTAAFSVDVERAFSAWYRTSTSQSFGSQFTAALNVTLSVAASALDSVTVSATNDLGQSEPRTHVLR